MNKSKPCTLVCPPYKLSKEEGKLFLKRIKEDYAVHM